MGSCDSRRWCCGSLDGGRRHGATRVAGSVGSGRCNFGLLFLACRGSDLGFGMSVVYETYASLQLGLRSSRSCSVAARLQAEDVGAAAPRCGDGARQLVGCQGGGPRLWLSSRVESLAASTSCRVG
jgi:hypothetical protein